MILGVAVLWAGYTLAWWGWLGMTDQVAKGTGGQIWWPSIMDLIVPGKAANLSNTKRQLDKREAGTIAAIAATGNGSLSGVPLSPGSQFAPKGNASYVVPQGQNPVVS